MHVGVGDGVASGDGAGAGDAGAGDAALPGADDVVVLPAFLVEACPPPGEPPVAATGWTGSEPVRAAGCRPCGELCPVGGGPGCCDGPAGPWCGTAVTNTAAADALSTVAPAAAPQAAGRTRTVLTAPRISTRAARTRATPTGGSAARHPVRRVARIASITAARWTRASRDFDTYTIRLPRSSR